MDNRSNVKTQNKLTLDIYFLERCLKKSLYVILLLGLIAGIGTYVVVDYFAKTTYSSNVHLAVITRGGYSSYYDQSSAETAITRNISVLNSDSLWTQMEKKTADLKGRLSADSIEGTNLIILRATADSAYEAVHILKTALETYPELSGYFGSGYLLKRIDAISTNRIARSRRDPIRYGTMMVWLVWAAGCGLVGVYAMLSNKVHNLSQASESLDIKMLGNLHYFKKKHGQKAILINDKKMDISYLEEIDKLSASIQRQMDKNGFKKLMVSSIYENEGKSTVAANVALSLAKRGKKVVLLDLDLRRPAVAKIFDIDMNGKKGMSDFLQDEANGGEILTKDKTQYNLFRVYQGKAVGNAERLVSSEKLPKFFESLSRVADYLILDTPPVGVVQDAEILSAMIDATLLVIRQDVVRVPEINDVTDVLEEAGTTVLGGVLNMVKGERNSLFSRGSYGHYYYSYGYESTER